MSDSRESLTLSISDQELERRWSAVRKGMKEDKIDFLVMQNDNEWLGGYVKWFTDIPARNGYPNTVIFPIDDGMTSITCGGKPPGDLGPPAWTMRGVKQRLTAPFFRSLMYSNTYDAELAVNELKKRKKAKIGIVGKGSMSAAFLDYLRKELASFDFVEATEMVDQIKAVKSAEEIALIRKTTALQDEAIEYARKVIRPGRRDFEIVADVIHRVTELGSEEQLVIGGSGPVGIPVPMQKRHFQNRVVREGDQFSLMIEVNGPGGMYAECGRTFFVGKVPAKLYDANELCKETQKVTLSLLKPGADPGEIWRANNEYLVGKGQLPETRLYAHGQGYDLVERPAIRDDDHMILKAGMNITVHPIIGSSTIWLWVCDNHLITASGVCERLHKVSQNIFEV